MSTIMYGIKNCDTIKKARKWLEVAGIDYQFHDLRKDGLTAEKLAAWVQSVGWETLLNKRGTTWRQLPEGTKSQIDEASAKALMLDNPAIIKRPVLEVNGAVEVGFSVAQYTYLYS